MGLLSLAIWTPIFFGVVLLALGRDEQAKAVRWMALIGAVVSLLVTLPLYDGFRLGTSAMQFVEKSVWIERFNVHYHLGLDGLSFWFVPLTAFITVWWFDCRYSTAPIFVGPSAPATARLASASS